MARIFTPLILLLAVAATVWYLLPAGEFHPATGKAPKGGFQYPINGDAGLKQKGIPAIGLGTWLSAKDEVTVAVTSALDVGYRHIDGALIYNNEKQVGRAYSQTHVPRSDLWITSKLWNDAHHPSAVRPALEKTLSDLGLEYLDLYLIHWPVAFSSSGSVDSSISILDTWAAMEELVHLNLTRTIGISNFAKADVEAVLAHGSIKPYAHEFETHPYLQQQSFVDWHAKVGIAVIAYSPLANVNPTYHSKLPSILKDPYFVKLAELKGCSPAQAVLAWGRQRGTIVIPKSVHEKRIVENLGSVGIELTDSEMDDIAELDKKYRLNNPSKGWGVKLFADLDGA